MRILSFFNPPKNVANVFFGAAGIGNRWHSASDHSSPLYTSDWEQQPIARAE